MSLKEKSKSSSEALSTLNGVQFGFIRPLLTSCCLSHTKKKNGEMELNSQTFPGHWYKSNLG